MTFPSTLFLLQASAVVAALVTMALKGLAYWLTGSAGLLSDALESGINLFAAATAMVSLWYSARPADSNHAFGHDKIEFFSSGIEGGLVLAAGLGTIIYGGKQLLQPAPLEQLDLGMGLAVVAAGIDLVLGWLLLRAGRRAGSLLTESSGHHLMTDVVSTIGVLVGLGLVRLTGHAEVDGLVALIVGGHIMLTGFGLLRRSFDGLMDRAWTATEVQQFREQLREALPEAIDFHYFKTRRAGRRAYAEFHLVVPGDWTVRQSHRFSHDLEEQLLRRFPELILSIHIEPSDEPESYEPEALRRLGEPIPPAATDGATAS